MKKTELILVKDKGKAADFILKQGDNVSSVFELEKSLGSTDEEMEEALAYCKSKGARIENGKVIINEKNSD